MVCIHCSRSPLINPRPSLTSWCSWLIRVSRPLALFTSLRRISSQTTYHWNEWDHIIFGTLGRKLCKWQTSGIRKKVTVSAQTSNLKYQTELSTFRIDNSTQVWLPKVPKENATNTGINVSTNTKPLTNFLILFPGSHCVRKNIYSWLD